MVQQYGDKKMEWGLNQLHLRQDCCSPRPQKVEHSASASSASTCSVSLMRKVKYPPAHRGCFCQCLKQRARFKWPISKNVSSCVCVLHIYWNILACCFPVQACLKRLDNWTVHTVTEHEYVCCTWTVPWIVSSRLFLPCFGHPDICRKHTQISIRQVHEKHFNWYVASTADDQCGDNTVPACRGMGDMTHAHIWKFLM